MINRKLQTFSIDAELIGLIQSDIKRLGHGSTLSGWICQACREKIERKNIASDWIIKELKDWASSFPRKPVKQLISEIEEGHDGEI